MPATNNNISGFCFFTDTDLLNTQTSGNYGPTISANGNDRFRTTSMHSASNNAKAYAVCEGQILIQEVPSNPNIVNLILSPNVQPEFEIGFIKYFLYKGILKDSLIDSTAPTQIAARGMNDLTLKAWETQDKINLWVNRYYNNQPPSNISFLPPTSLLGIDYSALGIGNNLVVDSELVDKYFNKPDSDIQLLTVVSGAHIGDFQANSFGFEIIVEKIGHNLTFGEVRQFEHFIEVPSLGTTPNQKETFLHWFRKEKVHCYIDPAAFFGSFYGYGITAFTNGVAQTHTTDTLYETCVAKFANKNIVYLDIRNDFNYSLNAFGNYGQIIKLALDDNPATGFTNHNYYGSGWPIMTLMTADFGVMTNYSDRNLIRLQLPRGDNAMPIAYMDAVRTHMTFPKVIDRSFGFENKYGGLNIDVNNEFMPIICYLLVPFHSTLNVAISTHNKLTISKQIMNESAMVTTGTSLRSIIYLDHLFFPKWLKNTLANNFPTQSSWRIYNDYKYIDMFRFTGQEFMAKRGVATNPDGSVIFFAFPHNKAISNNSIEFVDLPIKTQVDRKGHDFWSSIARILHLDYQRYDFEHRGRPVYVESLVPFFNTESNNKYNSDDFIAISFTSQEYQSIEQILNSTIPDLMHELPISLYFQITDEFVLPQTEEVYCLEYLVLLCAFFEDSLGNIETKFYSTDIYKYQLRTVPDFRNHPFLTSHSEENPITNYLS